MKFIKKLLIASIALQCSFCSNPKAGQQESTPNKLQLLETMEAFNTAFQQGNVAALRSMVTENYVHTNSTSKAIGKTDWFGYLTKREAAITSGALEVLEYQMEDVEIQFHGTTALVTGKVRVTSKEGEDIRQNEYRITNIWVLEAGQWKRAGFHDGKIK